MKATAGLIFLGSLYAGALWVEYQTTLLLGAGCSLFAAGSALGLLAKALWLAPEGYERFDGLHVRPKDRRANLVRHIRFSKPARTQEWMKLRPHATTPTRHT